MTSATQPAGTLQVFVVRVGVGDGRVVVAHPTSLQQPHEIGLQRHALVEEDATESCRARRRTVLFPDGRFVVRAIEEDLARRNPGNGVNEHGLAAGSLHEALVPEALEDAALRRSVPDLPRVPSPR